MDVNDERIKEWIEKCPEHDNELLHSDDNGIVMEIRFNKHRDCILGISRSCDSR